MCLKASSTELSLSTSSCTMVIGRFSVAGNLPKLATPFQVSHTSKNSVPASSQRHRRCLTYASARAGNNNYAHLGLPSCFVSKKFITCIWPTHCRPIPREHNLRIVRLTDGENPVPSISCQRPNIVIAMGGRPHVDGHALCRGRRSWGGDGIAHQGVMAKSPDQRGGADL